MADIAVALHHHTQLRMDNACLILDTYEGAVIP